MAIDITDRSNDATHPPADAAALATLLASLEGGITSAVHEVNNPLAIISGNAQFLSEVIQNDGRDSDLVKSITDIEDASRVLAERLRVLCELKEAVRAAVDGLENQVEIPPASAKG